MDTPVVFQYQQALDQFRREGHQMPLLKRMSELISLLDLTSTLSSSLSNDEILDAALLIVMGELQARRGALLVRVEDGRCVLRAARGLPAGAPRELPAGALRDQAEMLTRADGGQVLAALGLELLCPVFKAGRAIAWLGLGPRADGREYGAEPCAFLRSVAACAATPIENGLMYSELKRVNERLSLKVYQLHGLFDVSRELTAAQDDASVTDLVTATLMGQLMVTRCGLYLLGPAGLSPVHERGLRAGESALSLPPVEAGQLLQGLHMARPVADLPQGALRERLERQRLALVVPLFAGGAVHGLLALGARASGAPFSDEDGDFAMTLGRQALAALESVRLQRMRLEKERQDRELQIAREIQQSLFPSRRPELPGLGVAAESRSCYQVGGDLYDFVALPGGTLALTVADVSGKGTPASILMASVHAWLQALAGTVDPTELMRRLNRFLFESTQANRYVTLFYAELDPVSRRLRYVNAGHVPPYHVRRDGSLARLECGGPVLGLLADVGFEAGETRLEPGDVVAVVTDGATEALSPDDEEFGDERIVELLRRCAGDGAEEVLASLFDGVTAWAGAAGCSDDLTALVVKADG